MHNRNPETGIRYGYISANSLNSDLVNDLQMRGRDVHWEEAKEELWASIKSVCKDYMFDSASDRVADLACEEMSDDFYDDEPIHEGELDGVKYRTSWLGGALHIWIFDSPYTGYFDECSPCVPGAGLLTSENPNGVLTYDVPKEWRDES